MSDAHELERRVARLEQEVGALKAGLSPGPAPRPPAVAPRAPRPPAAAPRARPRSQLGDLIDEVREQPDFEDDIIGRLFPRLGALALLIGAGFGFKYAVDQGWIGPGVRVILGFVTGLGLILTGEHTRRRGWQDYAQAVAGGGVALVYLSWWASLHLYGFVSPPVGFGGLAATSALAVALSLRHDSLALALIGVVASFVNPLLLEPHAISASAMYAYVLALDVAVVALAVVRRWPVLYKLAFAGSWMLYGIANGSEAGDLTLATTIFVIFAAIPFLSRPDEGSSWTEPGLVVANGLVYYFTMIFGVFDPEDHSAFTMALAVVYAAAAYASLRLGDRGRNITNAHGGTAIFLLTSWAFVTLEIRSAIAFWAIEGVCLLAVARFAVVREAGRAGAAVLVLSLVANAVRLAEGYDVTRLLLNDEAAVLVTQIVALYVAAALVEEGWSSAATVAAHVVTVLWWSLEAQARLGHGGAVEVANVAAVQFAYSTIWALYGAVLLVLGIAFRSRLTRVVAVVALGLTIAKMALQDLWMLETLQRVIGFIGIGTLLLVCSLTFHRFKALLVAPEAPPQGRTAPQL